MEIQIATSDPTAVDPQEIAELLERAGFFVMSINVNEGERYWEIPR